MEDPDDLIALEQDEACRRFSVTLIEACASRRLIDIQGQPFNQSRRFRVALLRDGRLDFARRKTLQGAALDAVSPRDTAAAVHALQQDIESRCEKFADLRTQPRIGAMFALADSGSLSSLSINPWRTRWRKT